jgi:DNA-binding CsgD family transcriptional regulator
MSNRRFMDLEVVLATASAISDPLSVREGDILDLIAQGRSNKEIARSLCIAPETVKTHVKHIFIKLNVEKRAQAVSRAHSLGLVGTYHDTTNQLGSPRVWNDEESTTCPRRNSGGPSNLLNEFRSRSVLTHAGPD